MSRAMITESNLTAIANAIRAKLGVETTYTPAQMATAIGTIHGEPVNQEKTATQNGEVTPDSGYDGLSKVTVAVPGATLVSKSITANGSYNPASDNADGYSGVTVNVPNSYAAADEGKVVSGGALVAQTARSSQITENGTYDTTENNSVTVNVSGGGGGGSIIPVVVSVSSTNYQSPKQPEGAFGNVAGNFWGANGRSGYMTLVPTEPIAFKKIRLSNYYRISSSTYWVSGDITVRASNDSFATYTDLYVGTGLEQSETQFEINLNNSTAYTAYRIICSDSVAYVGLGRIEIQVEGGGNPFAIVNKTDALFTGLSGQVIALPYTVNSDYEIEVDFEATYTGTNSIVGNSSSATWPHITIYSSKFYVSTGGNETNFSANLTDRHTVILNKNGNSVYCDGEAVVTGITGQSDSGIYYWIGGRSGSVDAKAKLYGYKITSISTGNIVCNLIPAELQYNGSKAIDGLWDTVNHVFYGNDKMTIE